MHTTKRQYNDTKATAPEMRELLLLKIKIIDFSRRFLEAINPEARALLFARIADSFDDKSRITQHRVFCIKIRIPIKTFGLLEQCVEYVA